MYYRERNTNEIPITNFSATDISGTFTIYLLSKKKNTGPQFPVFQEDLVSLVKMSAYKLSAKKCLNTDCYEFMKTRHALSAVTIKR